MAPSYLYLTHKLDSEPKKSITVEFPKEWPPLLSDLSGKKRAATFG